MRKNSLLLPENGYQRHVVLVAPEVHWNTGNIGRTCLGTGTDLHLVRPLGFSLNDKHVRRAGLDYWHRVRLTVHDTFDAFMEKMQPQKKELAFFTKRADKSFREMPGSKRLFLVFGAETLGLPKALITSYWEAAYRIPITDDIRCLNLSTAVGIALYESLRSII